MDEPGDVRASYVSLPEGIYLGESPAWAIHEFQTVIMLLMRQLTRTRCFQTVWDGLLGLLGMRHNSEQMYTYIHLYAAGNVNF